MAIQYCSSARSVNILAAAAAAVFATPVPILAQTWIRGPGTGDWSIPGNWSPAQVPGSNAIAYFTQSDSASRTINYNYSGPAVTLGELRIDQIGAGTNTLSMAVNSLSPRE